MEQHKRQRLVFLISITAAVLSFLGLAAVIILQMNVRFSTNQGFSFLGGAELEVLTASVFALILGLAYIHRSDK